MNFKCIQELVSRGQQHAHVNDSSQTILLRARQTRKIVLHGGSRIAVQNGYCWITNSRSQDDLILGPGQAWKVSTRLEVIISALGERPCELEIIGNNLPSTLLG